MVKGEKLVLKLFKETSSKIPAYIKFLKKHNTDISKVLKKSDIHAIPIMDKKNYIYKYHLEDFFNDTKVKPIVYASSGSSGKPTFWFAGDEQEEIGSNLHEFIFKKIFGIKKTDRTLVVVCFSMGIWIAGGFTLSSCKKMAGKGYNMTIITPSVEKNDIINAVKRLTPHYDIIIFAGYPPFLMDVMHEVRDRSISFRGKKVKMITAGDKFSEKWRDDMLKLIGSKDPYRTIISIYGSADATILGHETPLSIFTRRAAIQNKDIRKKIFGKNTKDIPALIQYHPDHIFFEEINGELVFTTKAGISLIRYNIHDLGKLVSYKGLIKALKDEQLLKYAKKTFIQGGNLPSLFISGRTDVAVTFYAINIFPEHIQSSLENKATKKYITGSFTAYHQSTKNNRRQKLNIIVEVKSNVKITQSLITTIKATLVEELRKSNIEYRKLYEAIGNAALPSIRLVKEGDKKLQYVPSKGIVSQKGRKPKMIVK